ncbi:hypothetical protein MKZ38_007111 [Zalerion maritima]|uniref:Nephrocystin 3-like N-terminal domain-containing protein n=1 Tax=Zalerion maritima TaxID=339359 RepID=A0AAD5WPA8_9PEZI|nr:hypothetical protein MKZ38_007111 [Zalerion maritima]
MERHLKKWKSKLDPKLLNRLRSSHSSAVQAASSAQTGSSPAREDVSSTLPPDKNDTAFCATSCHTTDIDQHPTLPKDQKAGLSSPAARTGGQELQLALGHGSPPAGPSPSSPSPSTPCPLSPNPPDTSSKSLWDKAKDSLSCGDKAWIDKHAPPTSSRNAADDLVCLAKQKQEQLCQGGKARSLWGREVSFSKLASEAIVWLNKFKEIGDVVVQYDPAHSALPWAAVRFILVCVTADSEQMSASLAVVNMASRIIHRCEVFEMLYIRSPTSPVDVPEAATQKLESALIDLYTYLLDGLVGVCRLLSTTSASRPLYGMFHPSKFPGLLAGLQAREKEVEREVSVCQNRKLSVTGELSLERLRKLLTLEEPILRVDHNVSKMMHGMNARELIEVLEWISPIKYREHHDNVHENRTENTCGWLLERFDFYEWKITTVPMFLWLFGIPGAGKTFASSRVIDDCLAGLASETNHESLAFFYCNRNEDERRSALSVLRSFIRQLSSVKWTPNCLHPHLIQIHHDSRRGGSGWTLDLAKRTLLDLFEFYPRTTLVLDGLDECHLEAREILLDFFESLSHKSSKPVRIFVSSRPDGDIRDRLINLPNIEICATDNGGDIALYVEEKIQRSGRWQTALRQNPGLKTEIVETLLDKSQGMFQWVFLQIEQLLNLPTEHQLRSRLGKLPATLHDAYDEILGDMEDEFSTGFALRAFQWVMCALKPLKSNELLAAVRINADTGEILDFEPTEEILLDWCRNLLVIDSQQHPAIWRVSHLSVVEYLETRFPMATAHCVVAKCTLTLLLEVYIDESETVYEMDFDYELDSEPTLLLDAKNPLQLYARHSWMEHAREQEKLNTPDPGLTLVLKKFLGHPMVASRQYRYWLMWSVADGFVGWVPNDSRTLQSPMEDFRKPSYLPIFAMCRLGLYRVLSDWWQGMEIDIGVSDGRQHTLLGLAVLGNYFPICKYLVEKQKNVDIAWDENKTLVLAAALDRIDILRFLVSERVGDINFSHNARSVLGAAVASNSIGCVNLLIEAGVDFETPIACPFSPRSIYALTLAASSRGVECVEVLINAGADINQEARHGKWGSALIAAAESGSVECVQALVDGGADVNQESQHGKWGSALIAAAESGSVECVQALVDAGADINMQVRHGAHGSALVASAVPVRWVGIDREADVVNALVQGGADVNMQVEHGEFGSALVGALVESCWKRHPADEDSDKEEEEEEEEEEKTDMESDIGPAKASDTTKSLRVLVDAGANVNMPVQHGWAGSALVAAAFVTGDVFSSFAARRRGLECVRFLIGREADVNMQVQHGSFGSALIALAAGDFPYEHGEGSEDHADEVVVGEDCAANNLDLSEDSEQNVIRGMMALVEAARGHWGVQRQADEDFLECLKVFLDAGVDVNMQAERGEYRNAMSACSSWRRAEMLMEAGAVEYVS